MRSALACLIFALSLAGGPAASAVEVALVTVEGEEIVGPLESIGADTVRVQGRDVPSSGLAEIRFRTGRQPMKDQVSVRLRNGDTLLGTVQSGGDKALRLKTPLLGEIEIQNDLVSGLLFPIKEPPSQETTAQFFADQSADHDQLLTPRGETVNCFLHEMTDKDLRFDVEGQERTLPFEQVAAFRYATLKPFVPQQGVLARVSLADGSRLSGRLDGYREHSLQLALAEGVALKVPVTAVVSVSFAGGRLVYLDELEPSVEQKPYVGGAPMLFLWRKNLSAAATALAVGRKEYQRGVGVHSYTRLSYKLDGQYARLLIEVGLDRTATSNAVCAWRIVADGKELKAGEAKAGTAAESLKLPVSGVNMLELICDYGPDDDDAGDFLDWVEARLVKD